MKKFKVIFNQTLMISTAILFGLGVQALINFLVGGETSFTWSWYMPFSIVLVGFLCSLPSLIILSLEAASGWRMWLRIIIHFLCLCALLTGIGFLFRWYTTPLEYGIIMLMYVVIYVLVWLYEAWMYRKEDKEINEKIRDFQDED